MSLGFNLDSLLICGPPRCLDFFVGLLLTALLAWLLEQYVAATLNYPRVLGERGGAPKARALLAPFLAFISFPFRRSSRPLRLAPSALKVEEAPSRVLWKRASAFQPTRRELAPERIAGAPPYLNGALLSGAPASLNLAVADPTLSALSVTRPRPLRPRALAAGGPPRLGTPLAPPERGPTIGETPTRGLPVYRDEGDAFSGAADLFHAAQGDFPRLRDSRAVLGSLGESAGRSAPPRSDAELRAGEASPPLLARALFPRADAPLPASAGERLSPANAPPNCAPCPEKRPAQGLAHGEPRTPSALLGLIRERLVREGVDLNNLTASPLKMAGAQTGQALLALVRRAALDFNPPAHLEEAPQKLTSPPPREDFATARALWDILEKESAFWRSLKVCPALSSWREGFSPEELRATLAGLESLALEKLEREFALARNVHPRFLFASDPARAEERLRVQGKAERILANSPNSFSLFPSRDGGAIPVQGPILASVRHAAAACPESPADNSGRAVLFLEDNGKTPLGYLSLGPAPVSQTRILAEIARFRRERDRVKVILAGAEYLDPRQKLLVKEAPASQKDGWIEGSLRARLAKGNLNFNEREAIALPKRSPDQDRLVAFRSPGAGKARQTALRETLPRVLKELKKFWGEKADAKARAFFKATVRRHRLRTGLKVLESLFEESRAPGGELIWKIAEEKRALAETAFDFTVLRTAVSPKILPDAELCRLYRRHQEISREIGALAGPLNLELWLKFFGESWRASPTTVEERAPRGENGPRAKAASQEESASAGEGGRSLAPLGPPRDSSPGGSFLQERLYELLTSPLRAVERPPLSS